MLFLKLARNTALAKLICILLSQSRVGQIFLGLNFEIITGSTAR